MAAKETTVNVRVSAETKARWQEAAGGPRKLSAWLTELANAASSPDAAEILTALGAQAKLSEAAIPLRLGHGSVLPNIGTPSDAANADQGNPGAVVSGASPEPEGEPQGPPEGLSVDLSKVERHPMVEQESSAGQCPRWMHHRTGVYCGTCKKVN